jgi:hypothetical protein
VTLLPEILRTQSASEAKINQCQMPPFSQRRPLEVLETSQKYRFIVKTNIPNDRIVRLDISVNHRML